MRALYISANSKNEKYTDEIDAFRTIIPKLEIAYSYTDALEHFIKKSPFQYDTIISSFTPNDFLEPIDLPVETFELLSWQSSRVSPSTYLTVSYSRSLNYMQSIITENPFCNIVVYSGADPAIGWAAMSKLGRQLNWIEKSMSLADDASKISEKIKECHLEFHLTLDGKGDVTVIEAGSRSPIRFVQSSPANPIMLKPHFLYKTLLFKEQINELVYLLNKRDVSEHELQLFFETYPKFLLGNRYKNYRSQVVLERIEEGKGPLIPDFILEPVSSSDFWKILELKRPNEKIVRIFNDNRKGFNSKILEVVQQLREYRDYFENPVYRRRLSDIGITVFRPQLSVIIGRDYGQLTIEEIIKAKADFGNIEITTYEELIEKARQMIWL